MDNLRSVTLGTVDLSILHCGHTHQKDPSSANSHHEKEGACSTRLATVVHVQCSITMALHHGTALFHTGGFSDVTLLALGTRTASAQSCLWRCRGHVGVVRRLQSNLASKKRHEDYYGARGKD
eukprot:5792779-Amphidinium_carterae.1